VRYVGGFVLQTLGFVTIALGKTGWGVCGAGIGLDGRFADSRSFLWVSQAVSLRTKFLVRSLGSLFRTTCDTN